MGLQTDLFNTLGKDLKPGTEYFNTTELKGSKLKSAKKKSKGQNDLILNYFRSHSKILMTPSYIHKVLFDNNTPITSVRRSMTSLANQGLLKKTTEMKEGTYGREEHTWKYNN